MNKTFYGIEVSNYAQDNGFVDYRTLSKCFDCILNNTIVNLPDFWDFANIENGCFSYIEIDQDGNETEIENDVFQWYIISENGADILKAETDEIIIYNSELDIYLWGVAHFGTSWDYVLTDIKL